MKMPFVFNNCIRHISPLTNVFPDDMSMVGVARPVYPFLSYILCSVSSELPTVCDIVAVDLRLAHDAVSQVDSPKIEM
jgi:hypothetical protein